MKLLTSISFTQVFFYNYSFILVHRHIENHNIFSFKKKTVGISDIEKEVNSINLRKATTYNSIPPKNFKKSSKVSGSVLHKLFHNSIQKSEFPQNLKLDDIN